MKAVIYESNAGSARRYAEMLASKLGVPAYSYKEAVKAIPRDEEAIFIGWIFANKIQGLPRAQKRWNLICAGATRYCVRTTRPISRYSTSGALLTITS